MNGQLQRFKTADVFGFGGQEGIQLPLVVASSIDAPLDAELFINLVRGVQERGKDIDGIVKGSLTKEWPWERLEMTVRAMLRAGVEVVSLNVTVTDPVDGGWILAFPCDGLNVPYAATVNFASGQTAGNSATVGVGVDGKVCFYAYKDTHLVVDVSGYHAPFVAPPV